MACGSGLNNVRAAGTQLLAQPLFNSFSFLDLIPTTWHLSDLTLFIFCISLFSSPKI